ERHQDLFQLADDPAALCEGRVCRWLRHRARNVSGWRIAAGPEREGSSCPADRLTRSLCDKISADLAAIADFALAVLLVAVSGFMFGSSPESMRAGAMAAAGYALIVIACLGAPIAGFVLNGRGKTGAGIAVAWLPIAGALVAVMAPTPYQTIGTKR